MEKRIIGNTGLETTVLCYGCAAAYARELITDQKAIELFTKAYNNGISFFDTGHSYGKAEERIGKALRYNSSIKRDNIVISTKCGSRISEKGRIYHCVSVDWLKESVELSLKRMNLDYIDILYIHGPHTKDLYDDKMLSFLSDLKSQHVIRATGANTFQLDNMKIIARDHTFDVVMLDYNIIRQDREPIIKDLYDKGIGVIAGQAMGEGVFLNDLYKVRSKKDLWYIARTLGRKASRDLFFEGFKYRFVNHLDNLDGAQVALKYVLDNKYVSSATFGTVSIEHLEKNIDALNVNIPDEIISRIKSTIVR